MSAVKMSLVDNDYVTRVETNLILNQDLMDVFSSFLNQVKEELVTGQTAYLHINGRGSESITLEVSQQS